MIAIWSCVCFMSRVNQGRFRSTSSGGWNWHLGVYVFYDYILFQMQMWLGCCFLVNLVEIHSAQCTHKDVSWFNSHMESLYQKNSRVGYWRPKKTHTSTWTCSCNNPFVVIFFPDNSFSLVQLSFLHVLLIFHRCSGVSSFNQFIHEFSVDSDTSSNVEYSFGDEDGNGNIHPASPLSQSYRFSRASSFSKFDRHRTHWIRCIFSWILFPVKFLLGFPLYLFRTSFSRRSTIPAKTERFQPSPLHSTKRVHSLKDHFIQRTTDRRRGVIEVCLCNCLLFVSNCY